MASGFVEKDRFESYRIPFEVGFDRLDGDDEEHINNGIMVDVSRLSLPVYTTRCWIFSSERIP